MGNRGGIEGGVKDIEGLGSWEGGRIWDCAEDLKGRRRGSESLESMAEIRQ